LRLRGTLPFFTPTAAAAAASTAWSLVAEEEGEKLHAMESKIGSMNALRPLPQVATKRRLETTETEER
jgi:hypothetical protein